MIAKEKEPKNAPVSNVENITEPQFTQDDSKNWDFYNTIQNVKPYSSKGGSNQTHQVSKASAKKRKHNRMQRNSRRINRNH